MGTVAPLPGLSEELLNALPDGIVISDHAGRIVWVNRQMEELSGYSEAELIGQTIESLVPPKTRASHTGKRATYIAEGRGPRPMGSGLDIQLLRRDRRLLPVDIALSPMEAGGAKLIVSSLRDATERRRRERAEQAERERLRAFGEIASGILGGEADRPLLVHVARSARRLLNADVSAIGLPAPDGEHLVLEVVDGAPARELKEMRLPIVGSVAGIVFRSGEAWRTDDAQQEEAMYRPMILEGRLGPVLVLPLRGAHSVLGTMTVANLAGGRPFSELEATTAQAFAAQAGLALEYSRTRDDLRRLAVLEDRERIGRELHDGVIQSLFAVGMNLQAAAAISGSADLEARLENAVGELDRAIRDLRGYIFGLRPGLLADRQLGQAISSLVHDLEEKSGITAVAEIEPEAADELRSRAGDVIQIVREALSNVARHSRARTCRVSLTRDLEGGLLVIDDDGHGFDTGEVGGGQGLGNLRDRVNLLNGSLRIESSPEAGTRLEIRIPRPSPPEVP